MKQVEVEIMGQSYRLSCPEDGESRLLEAVARVDAAMCKIRDNSKIRARDRIAVLAALNLAFDFPIAIATPPNTIEVKLPATVTSSLNDDLKTQSRYQLLIERLDAVLQTDTQNVRK